MNFFNLKNAKRRIALTIKALAGKMLQSIRFFYVKISNFGNDPLNMVTMNQVSDDSTRKNSLYEYL